MLGLLLAEATTDASIQAQHKLIELFTESDIFIKVTLVLTLFFSIASWAIIGMKYRQIKKDKNKSEKFLETFWNAKNIDGVVQKRSFSQSSTFHIYKSGIAAIKEKDDKIDMDRISYSIRRTTDFEIENLESYVPFLATTGSAAPFLGLFGTVWGILNAFWKLGHSAGTPSLEVVGPNIAEALTTTALGLIAAIPAVIFYNYFTSKIRISSRDLNLFADDLMNRIEDEYAGVKQINKK